MKKIRNDKRQPKRKSKSRKRPAWNKLEKATATYFASLSAEAIAEENRLGDAMAWASSQVNFDE